MCWSQLTMGILSVLIRQLEGFISKEKKFTSMELQETPFLQEDIVQIG